MLRLAARVHPLEPGEKSVLRLSPVLHCIVCRTNVAGAADRHAVGDHEVDELGHAGLFGPRRVILRNDHLGEMLDHTVLLRRKEERFVGGGGDVWSRLGMVLRAGEHPLAEPGERTCYRRHADIAENFPAFYSLPTQMLLSSWKRFSDSAFMGCVLALLETECQALKG